MKKHLQISISAEVESGFDEKVLEFLKPSLEGLEIRVLGVNVDTYACLYTLQVEQPWPEVAKADAEAGKGIDAQTVLEEPKPVEEATAVIDKAMLKKALYAVKDKLGTDTLLALYEKAAGGAKTLKDVKEADYAGLYSAAQEAINAAV